MLNVLAIADFADLTSVIANAFPDVPDGFVTNRTLIIGFVAALVLAFFAKLLFRKHDEIKAEQREESQEAAAISRDGPPSFNG
jgi:hypothetical protein